MPAAEIVAIVTGVIGCATAILTPCVRLALDQCSNYLKADDNSRNFEEEEGILRNIIEILENSEQEVDDQARLIEDARETLEMINKYRNINVETCDLLDLCWCLTDYRRSYRVGRCVLKIKKGVDKLKKELRDRGINVNELRDLGRNCGALVGEQGYKVIEEIKSNVLYDNGSFRGRIIGVYGACGVGKTEVVEHACDEILEDRRGSITFIWLEVSSEDDILSLQKKIAYKIDQKLEINDSVEDNAILLKDALMKKRNVLLVLDNMRKAFSLQEIGFPSFYLSNISIIIISRSLSVCKQMQCNVNIALKSLSDEEAYKLLVGFSGLSLRREIESNLKKIAKECGGLPLATIVTAKYLRTLNGYDFVSLTRCLKTEAAVFSNLKYMEDEVFQDLKFSYEQLKHCRYSRAKECLLYCTMYPRNHAFAETELTKCWVGEGLLRDLEGTDEKLGAAKQILEELKDSSLLESIACENAEEIVKMHPLVWDMVVEFEKENPRFFTKPVSRIEKFAYEDWSENIERVSLMGNNLKELPIGHIFHKLSTLILRGNPLDIQLDRSFFNNFPNLKILDLSDTQVRLGPESLSCLKHLTILLLRDCIHLTCLPSLSELLELMVLDVSGSSIGELPVGMNSMTKLLWLKLSRTRVKILPSLSELAALIVLDISGCHISELPLLSKLVTLMVLNVSGCPITKLPSLSALVELMYLDVSDCPITELPHGVIHLSKLVSLRLSRTQVKQFSSAFLAELRHLQELSTMGCHFSWVQRSQMQDSSTAAFMEDVRKLQCLSILEITFASLQAYSGYINSQQRRRLSSFKFCVGGLYKGELKNNSIAFIKKFPDDQNCLPDNTSELLLIRCCDVTHLTIPKLSNLKFLDVCYCNNLEHLFTFSVIDELEKLEEIVVAHCENLVKLIEKDSSMHFLCIFWWRLRKLTLFDLPKLQFTFDGEMMNRNVQEIGIWKCPKLQKFPIDLTLDERHNLLSPEGLKEIMGDKSWLQNLKQESDDSVPFLEKALIEKPPPKELLSRDKMVVAASDMTSGS